MGKINELDGNEALQSKEEVLKTEEALLSGLLAAANYKEDAQKVQVKRNNGPVLFEFRIRPLSESEMQACRKQATKMISNPGGRHLPKIEGEVDVIALRCYKILTATVAEDKERVWNNPAIKAKLNCLHAMDVIDEVIMAGEKDRICELIDDISGYSSDQITMEDFAKN